ncbi:hypothetical protein [Streptomyces sp. NPDC097981]|uniref:hypothetical protein n=1 Tax=Streptomyces sp. NPDC097981 TaxID=3155428 RepID=UPI003317E853
MTYASVISEVAHLLYTVHPAWTQLADLLQQVWLGGTPRGIVEEGPGDLLRMVTSGGAPLLAAGALRKATPAGEQEYPGFEQLDGVVGGESPNPRDPAAPRPWPPNCATPGC